jgi:hypothetical protein
MSEGEAGLQTPGRHTGTAAERIRAALSLIPCTLPPDDRETLIEQATNALMINSPDWQQSTVRRGYQKAPRNKKAKEQLTKIVQALGKVEALLASDALEPDAIHALTQAGLISDDEPPDPAAAIHDLAAQASTALAMFNPEGYEKTDDPIRVVQIADKYFFGLAGYRKKKELYDLVQEVFNALGMSRRNVASAMTLAFPPTPRKPRKQESS